MWTEITEMRNYRWWLSKKRRVQKKYALFCSNYYSPKEVKQLLAGRRG